MVLNIIQIPYDSVIIAHQKMKVIAYVSVFESILKLIVAYLVLYTVYDHLIIYGLLLLIVNTNFAYSCKTISYICYTGFFIL